MYSPLHDAFFIHVPKCAGSSIEKFLLIQNGFMTEDQEISHKLFSGEEAKKYLFSSVSGIGSESQHIQAQEAIDKKVEQFTKASYTFAIVRNPWDRWVSEYHYQMQMRPNSQQTLESVGHRYIKHRRGGGTHARPQWAFVCDDKGDFLVDDVFKYEDLDNMEKVLKEKLDKDFKLPWENKSHNKKNKHYSEFIDDDLRKKFADKFKRDEEIFGYSFEG